RRVGRLRLVAGRVRFGLCLLGRLCLFFRVLGLHLGLGLGDFLVEQGLLRGGACKGPRRGTGARSLQGVTGVGDSGRQIGELGSALFVEWTSGDASLGRVEGGSDVIGRYRVDVGEI